MKTNIAIWDVGHKAMRTGSLDSAIESVTPNDLDTFIAIHKNLNLIAFNNGQKAEALFNKYFKKNKDVRYVSLPSTSSANTGVTFENACKAWRRMLTN
jgi:hypoxanthine-DNA glycosylase